MKYILMMNCPRTGYETFGAWPTKDIKAHLAFMSGLNESLRESGESGVRRRVGQPAGSPSWCGPARKESRLRTACFRNRRSSSRATGLWMWNRLGTGVSDCRAGIGCAGTRRYDDEHPDLKCGR